MTHLRLKLSLAAVVLASAVGYLAFAGAQKGWVYTLPVDQFLVSPQQQTLRVRLTGTVADDNLQISKSGLTARFLLRGDQHTIPVAYHGVVPDMFKAGAEVIVEGKRDPAGVFKSDLLMTKCASKYEEGHDPSKGPIPQNHPPVPQNHPPVSQSTPTGATP